jgi:hypothetical protein
VAAVGGAGIPEAAELRVRVASDGGLAGYHIALGRAVRIVVERGALVIDGVRFVRR